MNAIIPSANNLAIGDGINKMSEELLVSAAKSGDALAFVELSKRHSNKILRRVYRIVKNWQDAEDVLQESLMRAFLHLKEFEEMIEFLFLAHKNRYQFRTYEFAEEARIY